MQVLVRLIIPAVKNYNIRETPIAYYQFLNAVNARKRTLLAILGNRKSDYSGVGLGEALD